MDNVISNMAENILLMMTLTKITVARVNRKALSKLLAEIKDCSLNEKYETKEEKLTFLNYTKLPLYFIIIIASSMTIVEILYYLSGLTYGIQSGLHAEFDNNVLKWQFKNVFMENPVNCIPHQLSTMEEDQRGRICESLLTRQRGDQFLSIIVSVYEK
ncbi:hypothetical protein HZH68_017132 [Vespula germanica]|uniref:Uncharacterized protein n=1 Tax=Vespula germanica TaxID=30212 RepID=A0A834J265_VESGE|nr:hypothetical protein HZH68_017132 [Vespula germanica]